MTLLHYLIVCCIVAGLLGLREAFRFRLLLSSAAMVTTGLSVVGVFIWLVLVISAFFVLPILQAIVILIVPFVVGNVVRVVARTQSAGDGIFSEERTAELELEKRLVAKVGAQATQEEHLRDLVTQFNLTTADFELLYDRLKRQGLEHAEALNCIMMPKVVEYYFKVIGREDQCTIETSMQLTLLARNPRA